MTNDPREALQDIAAAAAEDMQDFRDAANAELEPVCPECDFVHCECDDLDEEFEDDGQPSEYDEWQDFYGGDDWDQGQYDAVDDF
jgi:hypothetical protein